MLPDPHSGTAAFSGRKFVTPTCEHIQSAIKSWFRPCNIVTVIVPEKYVVTRTNLQLVESERNGLGGRQPVVVSREVYDDEPATFRKLVYFSVFNNNHNNNETPCTTTTTTLETIALTR